jgi:hypothetical protein
MSLPENPRDKLPDRLKGWYDDGMFAYYSGNSVTMIPFDIRRQECRDAWRKGWFFARDLESKTIIVPSNKDRKNEG